VDEGANCQFSGGALMAGSRSADRESLPNAALSASPEASTETCEEGERLSALEQLFRTNLNSAPWPFIIARNLVKGVSAAQAEFRRHSAECQVCLRLDIAMAQRRLETIKRGGIIPASPHVFGEK